MIDSQKVAHEELISLIEQAKHTHELKEDEIAALLMSKETQNELFAAADETRKAFVGDGVHLRALIEFSSFCRRDCLYCGLRRSNRNAQRFRMIDAEIIALAEKAKSLGFATVVLQSGEDMFFSAKKLAHIIEELKKLSLVVTLSIGERLLDEYKQLKAAGADRFLLRLETTDEALYEKYDPGMTLFERKRCLNDLRNLGFEVGTGSLVGLPHVTEEMLARDILTYKALDADMVGIGPFIPHGDTPLAGEKAGDVDLTLRMVALTRLMLPEANIPATTALSTLDKEGRKKALMCGANVVMPNVTEESARKKYALYPGKALVADRAEETQGVLKEELAQIGRFIADGEGSRRKTLNKKD